jgi:aryl-alcohol dehydrogenase-like predicted oxidoreductase
MKQVQVGEGARTTCIGVGAMSFADFYGPTTEAQSFAVLDAAIAAGVRHIDTANVYGMGRSEQAIGAYLKSHPGLRDSLHIATKAAITRNSEGQRYFDNAPDHLEQELDASLSRLGVDCVDLFYIHRRDPNRPIEEVTETLARLVEKGKTRAFGYSEIAPSSLLRAHAIHPVAAVQSEYSLWTRSPEMGLVQTCAELSVALVAFSPVGRSMLTDAPLSQEVAATLPFLQNNPRFMAPNHARNVALSDRFRQLAAEMQMPAAGLAIAWLLARGDHILPIPGTRSVDHLKECLAGADMRLSADDIARIEAALPIGWAHGDRYSADQWVGPERYC